MSDNMQLISLSRQIALERQMDIVANNLANISTTGFKAEDLLFTEYPMRVDDGQDFSPQSQLLSFTEDWASIHDMQAGAIEDTGNPLDVALQGPGFLTVQTPNGVRYTRDGSLTLDADGRLVDLDGDPILGEGGLIQFGPEETDIAISRDGSISSSAGAKDRLAIAEFADPESLTRVGQNLFSGGTPIPATETRVRQGAIEKSNVSGVAEITQMIRIQRNYETLMQLMARQDEIATQAVRTLGTDTTA
jgi:flagellar basal-body rod protein FlgF